MTTTQCPHGLDQRSCEICRVLGTAPPTTDREPVSGVLPRLRTKGRVGLGVGAVLVVVALVVLSQVIAVVWSVLRVLQLVAVAALAGWIGWKAGVAHGRRSRP